MIRQSSSDKPKFCLAYTWWEPPQYSGMQLMWLNWRHWLPNGLLISIILLPKSSKTYKKRLFNSNNISSIETKFAVFVIFSCFCISFIGARTQFHSWGNVNATELGRKRVLLSRPVNDRHNFYFTYPDVRQRFHSYYFHLTFTLATLLIIQNPFQFLVPEWASDCQNWSRQHLFTNKCTIYWWIHWW